MIKKKKYLFITGATGFIGRNFVNHALKKKYKIFALSRKKQKKNNKIIWLKGEMDDNYDKYLKKTFIFIHFAAAGVNNKDISFQDSFTENVLKPYNLLLNCIKNKCKKWIIVGSASEYGDSAENSKELNIKILPKPKSNYEKSKYLFSQLALSLSKKNNVRCRLMRVFNVYGKGENKNKLLSSLKSAVKKNIFFTVNSSNQKKDFINIREVTKILIDSLNFKKNSQKFPQIWHVASGKPITVKNFVKSKIKKDQLKKIKFKNTNKIIRNFISSKNSIWKI